MAARIPIVQDTGAARSPRRVDVRLSGRTIMNVTIWQSTRCRRVAAGIGVALAVVLAAGRIGIAHGTQSRSGHALSRTWFVEVTLRNCANQAPLGSVKFPLPVHPGGPLGETPSHANLANRPA